MTTHTRYHSSRPSPPTKKHPVRPSSCVTRLMRPHLRRGVLLLYHYGFCRMAPREWMRRKHAQTDTHACLLWFFRFFTANAPSPCLGGYKHIHVRNFVFESDAAAPLVYTLFFFFFLSLGFVWSCPTPTVPHTPEVLQAARR